MSERSDTAYGPPRMWLTVLDQERLPVATTEIDRTGFTIGRNDSCDLVLADPKVSRVHASISPGAGPMRLLYDLGSANGTLVNGEPVRAQVGYRTSDEKVAEITGGEILQFGDTLVVATLADPTTDPPRLQAEES